MKAMKANMFFGFPVWSYGCVLVKPIPIHDINPNHSSINKIRAVECFL